MEVISSLTILCSESLVMLVTTKFLVEVRGGVRLGYPVSSVAGRD